MASMTTRAAVLHEPGTDWEITELDLDEPKDYEVLIRYKAASGLCHSDEHLRTGGGTPGGLLPGGSAATRAPASPPQGRPRGDRAAGGRPRGHRLHPRLRQVPLLLHRASEPV